MHATLAIAALEAGKHVLCEARMVRNQYVLGRQITGLAARNTGRVQGVRRLGPGNVKPSHPASQRSSRSAPRAVTRQPALWGQL